MEHLCFQIFEKYKEKLKIDKFEDLDFNKVQEEVKKEKKYHINLYQKNKEKIRIYLDEVFNSGA